MGLAYEPTEVKKMKKTLLLLILLSCPLVLFAGKEGRSSIVDDTLTFLERNHPDLYNANGRDVFERTAEGIKEKAEDMTDIEFVFALSSILSLAEDSHTLVSFSQVIPGMRIIPVAMASFSDGFRITACPVDKKEYLGRKVVAINGQDITTVLSRLEKYISHDNKVWLERTALQMLTYSDVLELAGLSNRNDGEVCFVLEDGSSLEIQKLEMERLKDTSLCRLEKGGSGLTERNRNKAYFYIMDEDVCYIQYNSCKNDPDYPFSRMVEEIKEEEPMAIIVDLRSNTGGSDGVISPLFKYLEDSRLPVAVLIGKDTFSSAIINAVELDAWFNALLVGSQTGGSVNHYGSVATKRLADGTMISSSTKDIDLDAFLGLGTSYGYRPLEPEVEADSSLENYISGFDDAYHKAYTYLKGCTP